jgi:hypothetical protein
MAHESSLWKMMKKSLAGPGRDLVRVENPIAPGTPDVNYSINGTDGWVELKEIDRWPKRPGTPVRIPHYTPQQRLWIRRRVLAGGRAFVLLRVNESMTYLLLPGAWAWKNLGKVPREELERAACCRWRGEFDAEWMIQRLTT